MKELDVRPILREGGEPFQDIMNFVDALEPGQPWRLLATFRPDPLLKVMQYRGYLAEPEDAGEGTWIVTFTPKD